MVNLTYIEYGVECNDKELKCKFGGPTITWKYKNVFAKDFKLIWGSLSDKESKKHCVMDILYKWSQSWRNCLEHSIKKGYWRLIKQNSGLKI